MMLKRYADVRGRNLYVRDKEGLKDALMAALKKRSGLVYCTEPNLEKVFTDFYGLECEPVKDDGSWYIYGRREPFDTEDFEVLSQFVHGYIELDYYDPDWDCDDIDILRLVYEYGKMTVKYPKVEWGRCASSYWLEKLKKYIWQDGMEHGESHVEELIKKAGLTNKDLDDLNLPEYTHFE